MDSVVEDTSGIGIVEGLGVAGVSVVLNTVGRKACGTSVVDTAKISGVQLMDSIVTSGIGIVEGLGVTGFNVVLSTAGKKAIRVSVVDTVDTVSISAVEVVDNIGVRVVGVSVLRTGLCDIYNEE